MEPMEPIVPIYSLAADSGEDLQITAYVDLACLTVLTYDTLLNINREYQYIWKSKWGLIKCLYLWSRYGTFLNTTLDVTSLAFKIDFSSCNILSKFDTSDFYRDGIMFYLVMLLIFITAVVLQIVAEPGLKSIGLM
ncbi:hypothetical protein B0H13DRAFT_2447819 [Mycena leptocephala]|nr:hypothetical protein B0H13DRAFT_2447819 [Mycena leptocephala]